MKLKYNKWQVILHWFSAVIIIWALITGFYVALFDVSQEVKAAIGFFNVSITTVLIPFFILRVIVMLCSRKVEDSNLSNHNHKLAKAMHFSLYVVIAIVLLSGVLMMDRQINVFGVLFFPQLIHSPIALNIWFDLHKYSCIALSILVLLHILAVIKHYVNGHKILKKMV
ncbi:MULTISPECIES: cytochrome b [Cysteiniphilum]|uniref:cytochrome b n=1 Tax=Cysteiniphilum TaxID=2056696 RepID=UPI00177F75B4|nr:MULTISPECIES: cytochrome b/b6 domain-containing protein [Cysteiniphilum]